MPSKPLTLHVELSWIEEAARMLVEAGAPQPWRDENALQALALIIFWDRSVMASQARAEALTKKARRAATTFQDLLVELIKEEEFLFRECAKSSINARQKSFSSTNLRLMNKTAVVLNNFISSPYITLGVNAPKKHWKHTAATLFYWYEKVVGPSGISRGGPAVRFIQAGLRQTASRHIELPAIEMALRRMDLGKQVPD